MKRLCTFLLFFLGGSGLVLIGTLSGCGRTNYLVAYKDVQFDVGRIDTVAGPNTPLLPGDSINYAHLLLGIIFENHVLNQAAVPFCGSSLYAYKPANTYQSIEQVEDLRIFSLQDYNDQFPAGTDLSESCTYTFLDGPGNMSKSQMISWLNTSRSKASEYNHAGGMALSIQHPPDRPEHQQFAIEVLTENRVLLRDTTEVFFLIP